MLAIHPRKIAVSLVVAAIAFSGVSSTAFAATKHHDAHHHHTHHHRHHVTKIPQHNGGDHDPDNNGNPSDGDGDI